MVASQHIAKEPLHEFSLAYACTLIQYALRVGCFSGLVCWAAKHVLVTEKQESRLLLAAFHVDAGAAAGGDGTSGTPFNSIAAGVSAAAASSGADSLLIHPRVYSESPVINDTSGDLIIQGTSGVAADVTVAGTGGHVFSITPANSVTIEDLSITNGGRGIYAHDGAGAVVVDNVVANGLTAAGVFLIRTGDVTIRNSQMNSDTVGIWMSDVGQVLVEDNQFDNHAQSGAVIDRATAVVVRNTTVSNNAIPGWWQRIFQAPLTW